MIEKSESHPEISEAKEECCEVQPKRLSSFRGRGEEKFGFHPDEQQKEKSPKNFCSVSKEKETKDGCDESQLKRKTESESISDGDEVKHVGSSTGSNENVVHPSECQIENSASTDFDEIDFVDT
ncbi:uncharacterized protein LOC144623761 isoform X6 [Crassostrea virginica]